MAARHLGQPLEHCPTDRIGNLPTEGVSHRRHAHRMRRGRRADVGLAIDEQIRLGLVEKGA